MLTALAPVPWPQFRVKGELSNKKWKTADQKETKSYLRNRI